MASHKLGRHEEALSILRKVEEEYRQYNKNLHDDIQEAEESLLESRP